MNHPSRLAPPIPTLQRLEPRVLFDTTPPTADVLPGPDITGRGRDFVDLIVSYADSRTGDTGIDLSTLGDGDVVVTGPRDFAAAATLVAAWNIRGPNSSVYARYQFPAPGGSLDEADNGTYLVQVPAGAVADAAGNTSPPASNPRLVVNVPPKDGPDLYVSAAEPTTPVVFHQRKERNVRPPLRMTLTNVGNAPAKGRARLFVSAGMDDVVGELPRAKVDLAPSESRTFRLKTSYGPASAGPSGTSPPTSRPTPRSTPTAATTPASSPAKPSSPPPSPTCKSARRR